MATFDPLLERCRICNSSDIYLYHADSDDISIFRCRECGVQFMNPQYTDRHLVEYYAQYTKEEPQWDEPLEYVHNFYLNILEQYASSKGPLLDVGSGKGHLLGVALQRGWDAQGYEIDCDLAKNLASKLCTEVQCGDFPKLPWQEGKFNAVVMHHVFEHLKDPVSYLQTIHRILKKGGVLFIVLPNINSISSRVKFFLEKTHMRTKNIGAYYDTSHHLWYFSPATLRRTLSGFDVLYMRSGHRVRPRQTGIRRFIMRNITERNLLHSTFLCVAQKRPTSFVS